MAKGEADRAAAAISDLASPPHQLTISAPRHGPRLGRESPDPRAERIRNVIPVAHHSVVAKQGCADLALARALADGVMDAQHVDAAVNPGIAGK